MKLFSLVSGFFLGFTLVLPVWAAGLVPPVDPAPLAALLAEVAENNPALLAAREQIAVAAAGLDQADALPDPQLSISLLNYPVDDLRSDVTPMTGNDFKLAQKFPFPGKLSTKRALAQERQSWAEAKYADLRLQLRQQVRDNWYLLGFQRRAIALTKEHLGMMDDIIRLAETRYEVGKGMQQEVLKAQVERSRLFDTLLQFEQKAEVSQARVNSLIGRATELPLGDFPEPVAVSFGLSLVNLREAARAHRPMFRAFDALIRQSEKKEQLAQLDYRPDVNVWAGYRFRDDGLPDGGTDFISGGLTINLPFPVAKRRAAVAEADAGLRMAHQQRKDFSRQVDLELHRSLTQRQQALKLVDLYAGGIVPQAEQTYKASLTAYQVDKLDFLSLHDALMTLYRYRIDYARAQADAQRSLARLRATTGLDEVAAAAAAQM